MPIRAGQDAANEKDGPVIKHANERVAIWTVGQCVVAEHALPCRGTALRRAEKPNGGMWSELRRRSAIVAGWLVTSKRRARCAIKRLQLSRVAGVAGLQISSWKMMPEKLRPKVDLPQLISLRRSACCRVGPVTQSQASRLRLERIRAMASVHKVTRACRIDAV